MRLLIFAVCVALLSVSTGCTGPGLFDRQTWIFGKDPPDDPALLARIGPTPAQRIALVRSMRDKMSDSAQAEKTAAELAERIQTETDPSVRVEIVKAFGDASTRSGNAVLRAGLGYPRPDPDSEVRETICQAWGRIGGDEAREMLATALANDTDDQVRVQAARALGAFKSGANMQALAPALEDADIAVQYAAMQSMKTVTGQDFGDNAKAWREYAQRGSTSEETPSLASRIWPWK